MRRKRPTRRSPTFRPISFSSSVIRGRLWASVAAQAEARLLFDVRQCDQIRPLSAARRTTSECTQSTHTNIHNMTQAGCWKRILVFFDKPKPHSFWLAKNCVAFFRMSLSSLRMRFSRQSRSFPWARPNSSLDTTSVSRCAVIHLFSADMPTPRSSATCLRVSPLVSACAPHPYGIHSPVFVP